MSDATPILRRYPCGVDATAEDTCDRCPDPDGCIDASYERMPTGEPEPEAGADFTPHHLR